MLALRLNTEIKDDVSRTLEIFTLKAEGPASHRTSVWYCECVPCRYNVLKDTYHIGRQYGTVHLYCAQRHISHRASLCYCECVLC